MAISIPLSVGLVNWFLDPFYVFKEWQSIQEAELEGNGNPRYYKIEYLKAHHKNFDSYLLGTSRTAFIRPSELESYIAHSRFYNASIGGNDAIGIDALLEYFLRKHYTVRNLYIQFGLDHGIRLLNPSVENNRLDYKWHYEITGECAVSFYATYLFKWHFWALRHRINELYFAKPRGFIEVPTGAEKKSVLLKAQREADIDQYIQNTSVFHKPRLDLKIANDAFWLHLDRLSRSLKNLVLNCEKYKINCIFVTEPHHYRVLEWLGEYREYVLRTISSAIPNGFWCFSYYNSITTDNKNYWEINHHIEEVAPLILARVFSDKNVSVPNDFGVFITKENLKESLEKIKSIEAKYTQVGH